MSNIEYRLVILGSGTCEPSARRGSPSLLIQGKDFSFLVDCGSGTLSKLAKYGIGLAQIDALFLTHFHPDHVSDIVPFLFANNYGQFPRTTDLSIIGAVGVGQFIESLQAIFEHWLVPHNYRLNVIETTGEPFILQGIQIKSIPVKHSESSLAYRFTDKKDRSIVISGDTDYCRELVDLSYDADVLVLECSHPDALKVPGHLSPRFAGRIAREAQCQRLILTHFYPPCDSVDIRGECRKEYSGEVYLAEDCWGYNL